MGTYFLNIVVCLCFCLFERGLVFAQNSQEYDALVEWRQEKKRLNHTHLIHTHEIQLTPVFFFSRTKKKWKEKKTVSVDESNATQTHMYRFPQGRNRKKQ